MIKYCLTILVFLFIASCNSSSIPDEVEEVFTECRNGVAADFPCSNIDLYAFVSASDLQGVRLNDIWGWTDPVTEKEYALIGLLDGVSIVDITVPWDPVVVAKAVEPELVSNNIAVEIGLHDSDFKEASSWRDLKTYQNTMYVVSEQGNHGLQVFDLTRIRDLDEEQMPVTLTEDARYDLFGNAHNININEETGFLYVLGSTTGEVCATNGGLHVINLQNQLNPEFAGCYFDEEAGGITRQGYIHDAQCVIYRGNDTKYQGKEVCFNSSELTFLITDTEKKSDMKTISMSGYEGNGYSHQGWLSEDHNLFYMNDELDELRDHTQTRTYVWDVSDLENPVMTGFFEHVTESVDHNLYVMDEYMYQANYTGGFRMIDISNAIPQNLREVGFFNTTPELNEAEFSGLWSVYPWFSGKTVVVSDINQGLFILRVPR